MNKNDDLKAMMPLFDAKKLELLKTTICKGATDDEIELFLHAYQRTGLDPFMRQIYAVKRWDKVTNKMVMTIQTGIDGYRLIAERTGKYSPGREPFFVYGNDGQIISATAYIKKQTTDNTWHEVAATAFFSEYCQKDKNGQPTRFWQQMGHTMIAKCAEALALRKAFPGDLSGIYTSEEMQQAEVEVKEVESEPIAVPEKPKNKKVPISAEQAKIILHMLKGRDDIERAILIRAKIKSIDQLPERAYEGCVDWIDDQLKLEVKNENN
jgi:phage recombination protein Bet